MSYPIPPNTRTQGSGIPFTDIDQIVNALVAMGEPYIVAPSGDTSGVTDTNLVQSLATALNAAANPGGIILFRPGRFYITQMLLYSGVEYVGTGQANVTGGAGTIITAPAGSTTDMVVPSGSGVNQAALRHLTFDGGNGNSGWLLTQAHQFACINFTVAITKPILEDLAIYNCPGDSIVTASGSYGSCSWRFLRILNGYGRGLNLAAGADIHLTDVDVGSHGLSSFVFGGSTIQAVDLKSNFAGLRGVPNDTHGIMITGNACTVSGGVYMQNDVGAQTTPSTFTATNASPCVFTVTAGQVPVNGTQAVLAGGSLPTGFTAGPLYYVVAATGTTFELAATVGGTPINSTSTGSGTIAPNNGNSIYVSGTRNRVDVTCSGSSGTLLYLDSGATDNAIDIHGNNQQNQTNPAFIYQINNSNVVRNRVRISGNSTFLTAKALLANGGTEANNQFTIDLEDSGVQVVAFATPITPDPYLGSYVQVGTLTGIITINAPANGHPGSRIIFRLTQDGTGHVITFNGNYHLAGGVAVPTTASSTTEIGFICESTGGIWREFTRATTT